MNERLKQVIGQDVDCPIRIRSITVRSGSVELDCFMHFKTHEILKRFKNKDLLRFEFTIFDFQISVGSVEEVPQGFPEVSVSQDSVRVKVDKFEYVFRSKSIHIGQIEIQSFQALEDSNWTIKR